MSRSPEPLTATVRTLRSARTLRRIVAAAAVAGVALVGAFGGAVITPTSASAGVDDFSFTSFHGAYSLGADAEGRSTLTTVETLVAQFPEIDQNHGIRRNLVERYDGHPTALNVVSVTDENGMPRPYEAESDDDVLSLTIAADDYVHGAQTYVITYTQRDVTRFFSDTDADEFYWDTNGTDWSQPFGSVTADVHIAEGLRDALTGAADAASGGQGANGPATVTRTEDGYRFEAADLGPHENLSFAIGFAPGTFTARDSGFWAAPWPALALAGLLIALAMLVWAIVVRSTRLRDAAGRPTIIAEYLPPKGVGVMLGSVIRSKTTNTIPAQILTLAVAGRIRVVETPGGFFSSKPKYELEFLQTRATGRTALRELEPSPDDLAALHALFGSELTPGERRSLSSTDQTAAKRLSALLADVRKRATTDGLRRRMPGRLIAAILVPSFVATMAAIVFGAIALDQVYGGLWPLGIMIASLVASIASAITLAHIPLEASGAEVRDHLAGLDEYIALAEADRLRYLQSPQGAERTPIAADDPRQVLELNERLLPWAVLFGREKQWSAELGRAYEQLGTQPGWYAGTHPFSAAVFASSVAGMSSSVTSAYSSSSGGSGGGVSSGGGGGGGGGGGV